MMTNIKELYYKPYITIPFETKKGLITESIKSFFDFINLPDTIKNHIDLRIFPMHRRGEIGFKHRDPEGGIYNDSKDYFHYHPIIEQNYSDFIDKNTVVKRFIKNASLIWEQVYETVHDVLSNFERDYPNILSKVFDTDVPHIVVRFLSYKYKISEMYLAKPHFDAGSFTLAIAESNPGLRIGTNPDDLELVAHKDNSAIFMISSNIKKIINDDLLKPAWHDVVQLDKSAIGQDFSRWAIVAFIDGYNVESLPQTETHKFYI